MTAEKVISCTASDGTESLDTYWFSLDEYELEELASHYPIDLDEFYANIVEGSDLKELIENLRLLLQASVGMPDGYLLVKNEFITRMFVESGAYDSVFIELLSNPQEALEFFSNVFPESFTSRHVTVTRDYTDEELLYMSEDDFVAIAGPDRRYWSKRHLGIFFRRRNHAA